MKVLVVIGGDPFKLGKLIDEHEPGVTYVFDEDLVEEGTKVVEGDLVIFTRQKLAGPELDKWLAEFGADCEITVVKDWVE